MRRKYSKLAYSPNIWLFSRQCCLPQQTSRSTQAKFKKVINLANCLGCCNQVSIKILVQSKLQITNMSFHSRMMCAKHPSCMQNFASVQLNSILCSKKMWNPSALFTRISTFPKIFLKSSGEISLNFASSILVSQATLLKKACPNCETVSGHWFKFYMAVPTTKMSECGHNNLHN